MVSKDFFLALDDLEREKRIKKSVYRGIGNSPCHCVQKAYRDQ